MSAEVSEVVLLLKFAFREKAVAPLAEAPGFREFPMRDLNFALFLFRFQSLCLGAFEADAFVFVDPEHFVFGNCFCLFTRIYGDNMLILSVIFLTVKIK